MGHVNNHSFSTVRRAFPSTVIVPKLRLLTRNNRFEISGVQKKKKSKWFLQSEVVWPMLGIFQRITQKRITLASTNWL